MINSGSVVQTKKKTRKTIASAFSAVRSGDR